MFHSFILDEANTPPQGSLLRPNWLVNARTLPPKYLRGNTRSAPPAPPAPPAARPRPLMMPDDVQIAAAAGPVQPRGPKGTSHIGIEHFKSGVDDFDEYVEMFEKAVDLATKAPTQADREKAYWDWLLLRLDKPARAILSQAIVTVEAAARAANRPATWQELKDELKTLLIDPHEEYKWHAKLMTIKWDGVEAFHALASRVISAVNKFDKAMDEAYKKREYFLRFRMALPKEPYQDAIDMNIGFTSHSIKDAILIAQRAQLIQSNKGDSDQHKQVTFAAGTLPARYGDVKVSDGYVATAPMGSAPSRAPSHSGAPPHQLFGNADIQDSRTSSLESSLAGINTNLENLRVDMRSYDSRIGNVEKEVESLKRAGSSGQGQNPNFWPPQNQGPWLFPNYWPPQGGYQPPQGGYQPPQGGYSAPYRPPSPYKSNSPHRSNQNNRPQSPHRGNQQNRPNSPRQSTQSYNKPQSQYPNQQYPNQQYPNQQHRSQSPNRSNQYYKPPSPRAGQRPASPNRSNQQYFPPSPGKQFPQQSFPNQQYNFNSNDFRPIDTGDEASGYESEVDPEAEVARLQEELEKAKAKAKAKRGN